MPNSPKINFKIENNNLEQTTPLTGVSCILARTTEGPYNDPSQIISTPAAFKRLYGSEIVPDGTPSNIEKALIGGSKLRVIRVPGEGYFKGILVNGVVNPDEEPEKPTYKAPEGILYLNWVPDDYTTYLYEIGFFIKTYDQKFYGASSLDVIFTCQGNTIYCTIKPQDSDIVLESKPVITYKNPTANNKMVVDYLTFYNWLTTSAYLEPYIVKDKDGHKGTDISSLINWLAEEVDGAGTTSSDFTTVIQGVDLVKQPTETSRVFSRPGYSGTTPTKNQWIESLEYIRDYVDPYHVACSHLDQHLSNPQDQLAVHKAAKLMADELNEFMYFIEVPKYTTHYLQGTNVRNKAGIVEWVKTCLSTIGNSKYVAYFAGGLNVTNNNGIPVKGDVLGSIIGLADASASNHGPWLSFAGVNRGVLYDANGPACLNYGSPSRYDDLNEIAHIYTNMIVVKDTPSSGKQTMLWHCFTSQIKQDSFKFISIVQLVLYLKKFIRPILESKIEEPNYIPTWRDIYYQVKPELDNLVTQEAISEYTWMGDQDASGYEDMQVNKEADVRQGRYKAILKFKEIVPMQEVEMSLVIDKVSRTSSVELNS